MSNFDFEGTSGNGDWDERSELFWGEEDWRLYLNQQNREIARFITLYRKLNQFPNHLDDIAKLMGWDVINWSNQDWIGEDIPDQYTELNSHENNDENDDFDPYTIHRHPVFIVTSGIFHCLKKEVELLFQRRTIHLESKMVWNLSNHLQKSEINILHALQAIDMGDFALAICHLKISLSEINDILNITCNNKFDQSSDGEKFVTDIRLCLFDLREMALRIVDDCRVEIKNFGQNLD